MSNVEKMSQNIITADICRQLTTISKVKIALVDEIFTGGKSINSSESVQDYENLLEIKPNNPILHLKLAWLKHAQSIRRGYTQKDWEPHLRKAFELGLQNLAMYQNMATISDIDEGIAFLKKAVALFPNDKNISNSYIMLGDLYCKKQMYNEAISMYELARNNNPNYDSYICTLITLVMEMNRQYDDALKYMGRFKSEKSLDDWAKRDFDFITANIYYDIGKIDEAVQIYQRLISYFNNNCKYNLSCCLIKIGQVEVAKNFLTEIIKQEEELHGRLVVRNNGVYTATGQELGDTNSGIFQANRILCLMGEEGIKKSRTTGLSKNSEIELKIKELMKKLKSDYKFLGDVIYIRTPILKESEFGYEIDNDRFIEFKYDINNYDNLSDLLRDITFRFTPPIIYK